MSDNKDNQSIKSDIVFQNNIIMNQDNFSGNSVEEKKNPEKDNNLSDQIKLNNEEKKSQIKREKETSSEQINQSKIKVNINQGDYSNSKIITNEENKNNNKIDNMNQNNYKSPNNINKNSLNSLNPYTSNTINTKIKKKMEEKKNPDFKNDINKKTINNTNKDKEIKQENSNNKKNEDKMDIESNNIFNDLSTKKVDNQKNQQNDYINNGNNIIKENTQEDNKNNIIEKNNNVDNKEINMMNNQMNHNQINMNQNPNHNQNIITDNKINQKTSNYSFSRYTKAPLTVLKNINDTSYLNSVLQLLGSIRNIASYFLNPKNQAIIEKDVKKYPLSFVFYRLFTHLYPYPERQQRELYNPECLLEVLGLLNVVYKTKKARNPNELISFILNTLHKEININKNNNNQQLNPNINDRNDVIKNGIYHFQKSNNSIISNTFNWFDIKEFKCNDCNKQFYNFYTFNTFELDILGAFKFKNGLPISLIDCLQYHKNDKKEDFLCQYCKKKTSYTSKSNIFVSPNMFIFSLDRGNLDNKLQVKFHLEEKINLSNFIIENSPKQYELTGIVSILKEQNKYKYVCFCKSPVDNQWYLYNDETTEPCELKNVIKNHNDYRCIPCILAYNKMSDK